jgi:hypothetical protein
MSISGGQKRSNNYKQNPATTIEKNTEEREKIADSTGDTKRYERDRDRDREGGKKARLKFHGMYTLTRLEY